MFKNPRHKTEIVHLALRVYPGNTSSYHKTYLDICKEPHTYLFLDLTQSINDLLKFKTKIFPGEMTEGLHLFKVINRLKSQLQFPHLLKDAKPQARRALLTFASDDLIKAIVNCPINTLNANHKLTKDGKSKFSKYKQFYDR